MAKTWLNRFQKTIILGFAATVLYKDLIECLNFKLVLGSRAPAGAILYPKKDARTQPKSKCFFFRVYDSLCEVGCWLSVAPLAHFLLFFDVFDGLCWFFMVFHVFKMCFHVFFMFFPSVLLELSLYKMENMGRTLGGSHYKMENMGRTLGGPSTKSQTWLKNGGARSPLTNPSLGFCRGANFLLPMFSIL